MIFVAFLSTVVVAFMGCAMSAEAPVCDVTNKTSASDAAVSLIQINRDQIAKTHHGAGAGLRNGDDIDDLFGGWFHQHKMKIFKSGDSFGAAYLWSAFLLQQSHEMTDEKLTQMFSGFCAVTGNTIDPEAGDARWRVTLDEIEGGKRTGYMYYCCWPCVCDTRDHVKIDTKTVRLSHGKKKKYYFAVIGNPCDHPEKFSKAFDDPFEGHKALKDAISPDVQCDKDGKLKGAHTSDHGYIILTMFSDVDQSLKANHEEEYEDRCRKRAHDGYKAGRDGEAGMGKVFQKLAGISPVKLMNRKGF